MVFVAELGKMYIVNASMVGQGLHVILKNAERIALGEGYVRMGHVCAQRDGKDLSAK